MHIYFSGIGGVGIGPLAEIAIDAGYVVSGSDLNVSPLTQALSLKGADVHIGQDGSQIETIHRENPIDWLVYTSALPEDHPELQFAAANQIRSSKREELLAHIIDDKQLKLIAVAGTHGKTTTTGMLIWLFKQLGIPISYSIGTTINFGPSGLYDPASKFFVYECDEYDRNFLHFSPWISLITSIDHDHHNIYPTTKSYKEAFLQFIGKSSHIYMWQKDADYIRDDQELESAVGDDMPHRFVIHDEQTVDLKSLALPGEHNRRNGYLAIEVVADGFGIDKAEEKRVELGKILKDFPGTDRRFEKLDDNLYTDYGHHPVEIAATLQMARELNEHVVLVYQPHQNSRQHEVRKDYKNSMLEAEKIYWLPTYLSREDPELEVLSPKQLIGELSNKQAAEPAEMDAELWSKIEAARNSGKLVIAMGAGTIDGWVRARLAQPNTAVR